KSCRASNSAMSARKSAVAARSPPALVLRLCFRVWSSRCEREYLLIAELQWPGAGLGGHGSRGLRIGACTFSANAEPCRAGISIRYEICLGAASPKALARLLGTPVRV